MKTLALLFALSLYLLLPNPTRSTFNPIRLPTADVAVTSDAPVVDTDGDALVAGETYYITSIGRGAASGGVQLAWLDSATKCASNVVISRPLTDGDPVTITPADPNATVVLPSTFQSFAFFVATSRLCVSSVYWGIRYDELSGQYFLSSGEFESNLSGQFKIEAVPELDAYKITYCPFGGDKCYNVGKYNDEVAGAPQNLFLLLIINPSPNPLFLYSNNMLSKYRPSSPFPSPSSCFRLSPAAAAAAAADLYQSSAAPPSLPAPPTLATSLYRTGLGLFAVTWSRDLLGRSFHLHFLDDSGGGESSLRDFYFSSLSGAPSFHFRIKPFMFSKKQGSKKLQISSGGLKNDAHVFWDLSRAKFGSGPEPVSGFYIAVVVGGEILLLIGDCHKEAYAKTRARHGGDSQALVLKREHVYGGKLYATKVSLGGKERRISIDCRVTGDDPGLVFSLDGKRVLQIKHLKWKFRGNERIEVEGFPIQVSWDVHSWLFDDDDDGYALFTFKFEKQSTGGGGEGFRGKMVNGCGFGFETMLMKKGLLRSSRSSSSSSLSSTSASSSCASVMEWESAEENELKDPPGFSLLVYAWKS